ncbi:MAG TPA: alpha/beta hydrolase domain-containing protein [Bryobacteraceae bacterium]|jgi:hypothetical protein
MRSQAFVFIAAFALASLPGGAAVTRIEVTQRYPVASGMSFDAAGPYECVTGKVHFAVEPQRSPNGIVADISLAPRNSVGLVQFSADFYVLRPRDLSKGNGTALVEISNRGGKGLPYEFDFAKTPLEGRSAETLGDGFLLRHGFTLAWIGWEFDVPKRPELLRADLPIATDRGAHITGLVRSEWIGEKRQETIPLGDRNQTGYRVLDPNSPKNKMFVRNTVLGPRTLLPHARWRFSDPTHVILNGGFTPGRIYEVIYETQDPPVAGLGMAGVRDFVSFLKYGGAKTELSDESGHIKRAIGFGVSQSGRFLREFLYDGFNEDESHRKVFDGVWAHVAGAGRGSFNHRFAQPSRDGHPFLNVLYPVDVPPFDEEHLLARAHQAHVVPKLFLTNGSYEYWGRCASLIHTTADGKADDPPSQSTRIYFFSGSEHGVGAIPPRPAPAQNLVNTNDYRYALRALLLAMQRWLTDDAAPPPSRFPLLQNGDLTTIGRLHFKRIPGVTIPQRKREAYRLDFSTEPPQVGPPFPTFVPQVDADGNELGGIRMPEIAVPLASYTGWNLRSPSIGAPSELLSMIGSWIPFTKSSIVSRYRDEQEYLNRIDAAGRELVRSGFLLESDLARLHRRAAEEWEYANHS